MKVRYFLITCAAILLGALFGRFHFLKEQNSIGKETSFLGYLTFNAEKPDSSRNEETKDSSSDKTDGKTGKTKKTSSQKDKNTKPKPKIQRSNNKPPLAKKQAEKALADAKKAMESGQYDSCVEILSVIDGAEAEEIRFHSMLLQQMVKDVQIDPGATSSKIFEVTFPSGNILHAVKATNIEESWNFTFVNGIKHDGLKVKSVKRVAPDVFRAKRRQEVQKRLEVWTEQGSFKLWKGIRLAWRRGFPREAYKLFAKLVESESAINAITMILPDPPKKGIEFAQAHNQSTLNNTQTAPPNSKNTTSTQETVSEPAHHTQPVGTSSNPFAEVDAKIIEARKKLYMALKLEGQEADKELKEAGQLLTSRQQSILSNKNLPRNEAYNNRLQDIQEALQFISKTMTFGLE